MWVCLLGGTAGRLGKVKGLKTMNAREILSLVNAGFTKADIMALTNTPATNESKPAEQPAEAAGSKPAEQPAEAAAEKPAEDKLVDGNPRPEMPAELAAALNNINNTLAKLQAYALKTDAQPAVNTADYKTILGSVYSGKKE